MSSSPSFRPPEGHRPRRSLGQNFLVDRGIQARIVEAVPEVDSEAGGAILEIGPGKGALTEGLAARGVPLLLVELDRELAAAHRTRWEGMDHVRVVEGDILETRLDDVVPSPEALVVVGNIPYNITTPILFHLLEHPRPAQILLMVQKEVGDRLLAPPGTGGYGALSVGVQSVARVERVLSVPAGAFRPRPRVDSVVMRITPLRPPPLSLEEERALRTLTRALFQWRRKQIGTTLRKHPDLVPGAGGGGGGGVSEGGDRAREAGVGEDRAREDRVPEDRALEDRAGEDRAGEGRARAGMSARDREGRAGAILEALGIDPRTRPEELPPARFVTLARQLLLGRSG